MRRALLWSRRELAFSALGAGLAMFLGSVPGLRAMARAHQVTVEDRLIAACRGLRCPRPIGVACRQAMDESASAASDLRDFMLADLASAGLDCSSLAALRRALRERSRQDFAAGRTRSIEGWVLSATEIRAYALASHRT